MDQALLVEPFLSEKMIEDGKSLIGGLQRIGFKIRASFWMKYYDEDRWRLFIAMPGVNEKGPFWGYAELRDAMGSLSDSEASVPFRNIHLIDSNGEMIRNIRHAAKESFDRPGIKSRQGLMYGPGYGDVYVYKI